MNKGLIITIIVIAVLAGGGLIYWHSLTQNSTYQAPNPYPTPTPTAPTPTSSPMNMTSTTPGAATSTPTAAPSPAKNPASDAVVISNFAFSPATLTVHKGTTVTWTNEDNVPHTVTGDTGGPSSSPLSKGATYSYTLNTIGSFPYHCSIHPNMKATIEVIN